MHSSVADRSNSWIDSDGTSSARVVAAVDIGSSSIRMLIAQVLPSGALEPLEQLGRGVRLGQDTFKQGRLTASTMRAAVAILRDYRRSLDLYGVTDVRAVATSAVREAENADTFIDRVYIATGINIEIISTAEESRLTVLAVLQQDAPLLRRGKRNVLLAEVGGGSTLLTVLREARIVASLSLHLGSIRLLESIAPLVTSPDHMATLLRQQAANVISANQAALRIGSARTLIAVGGVAQVIARQVGRPTDLPDVVAVSQKDLEDFIRRSTSLAPETVASRFGLPVWEAEALAPSLIIYQSLLAAAPTQNILVSRLAMGDGLLLEVAAKSTEDEHAVIDGTLRSAEALAQKYNTDMKHARHVADLSLRLFDELVTVHGLSPRQRLLLGVAGLVHDVGVYVGASAHHKHSYYLVANSEIFGLSRDELFIVAHVSRYHRRSAPKPTHADFMALSRDQRVVISKLAALLRVADALDRSHRQAVRDFSVRLGREDLVISVSGVVDLSLERLALASKADLFEDFFGLRIRLEAVSLLREDGAPR